MCHYVCLCVWVCASLWVSETMCFISCWRLFERSRDESLDKHKGMSTEDLSQQIEPQLCQGPLWDRPRPPTAQRTVFSTPLLSANLHRQDKKTLNTVTTMFSDTV